MYSRWYKVGDILNICTIWNGVERVTGLDRCVPVQDQINFRCLKARERQIKVSIKFVPLPKN